jgi:hypothetical protein
MGEFNMSKSQGIKFADHGTLELQAKGEVKFVEVDGIYKQAYVTSQTVIERLYNRKQVTLLQYLAARNLQNDYLKAHLAINLKARLLLELVNASSNLKDRLIDYCNLDAKKRYNEAMNSLLIISKDLPINNYKSNFYQKLIEWVIIENGYLKDIKPDGKKFSKINLDHLRVSLDVLIKFYTLRYG